MKKHLKKSAAMLSALVLAVSVLFAGGTKETAKDGPVEITFWSLFTGGDGEFFDAMVAEFNRTHSDITLKSDTAKFTDYYTKLTTALTSKNAPDIVVLHRDSMLPYVKSGVLYPLDEALKEMNAPINDFVKAAIDACKFNGKQYSLPLDVHPLSMYCNKDLLAKTGVTKIPQTYDELVAAAKKVQDTTGAVGIALDNTTAVYKAYTLTRMFISGMGQGGGKVIDVASNKPAFNTAQGKKVVQDIIDLANKYGVVPKAYDYDSSVADFKAGKAAFHINGVWATGGFEQQKGLNFEAVPFPALWGKPGAWAGSHTLAIPVQKKMDPVKVKAALTFILWMTEHGEMWAKAGHIPTRVSVRNKPEFKAMPYRPGYVTAADSVIPAPNTPAWEEVYGNLSDLLEYAVANNQSANDAIQAMDKKVTEILATY